MSNLSKKCYEEYKETWIKNNDGCDDNNCYVCYKEFLDNEFRDPEIMKHYLTEETFEKYDNWMKTLQD